MNLFAVSALDVGRSGRAMLATLMLLLASTGWTAEAEVVGRAIATIGTVEAIGPDGSTRTLRRQDPVFEGDTLRTGSRGRAQIRFTDQGLLSLRPDTEIAIDEYEFDQSNARANSQSLGLRQGGFRTITGRIADRNQSAYRVRTPVAVIGVRGTVWDALQFPDGPVMLGVGSGNIAATSSASGSTAELGDDAAYRYARMFPDGTVELLLEVPIEFASSPTLEESGGGDEGGDGGGEGGRGEGGGGEGGGGEGGGGEGGGGEGGGGEGGGGEGGGGEGGGGEGGGGEGGGGEGGRAPGSGGGDGGGSGGGQSGSGQARADSGSGSSGGSGGGSGGGMGGVEQSSIAAPGGGAGAPAPVVTPSAAPNVVTRTNNPEQTGTISDNNQGSGGVATDEPIPGINSDPPFTRTEEAALLADTGVGVAAFSGPLVPGEEDLDGEPSLVDSGVLSGIAGGGPDGVQFAGSDDGFLGTEGTVSARSDVLSGADAIFTPRSGTISALQTNVGNVDGLTWLRLEQPATVFNDPLNSGNLFNSTGTADIPFALGRPMDLANIRATSTVQYFFKLNDVVVPEGYEIQFFDTSAILDVSNAVFSGGVTVDLGLIGETVNLDLSYDGSYSFDVLNGLFVNGVADGSVFDAVNGTSAQVPFSVSGFMTGVDAEFAQLAFAFDNPTDASLDLFGLILYESAFFSTPEIESMAQGFGFVAVDVGFDPAIFSGPSTVPDLNGNVTLGVNLVSPGQTGFFDNPPQLIVRGTPESANPNLDPAGTGSLVGVVFGGAPPAVILDADSGAFANSFDNVVLSIVGTPTARPNLTGTFFFSNTQLVDGFFFDRFSSSPDLAPISGIDLSFIADLDTGEIFDGGFALQDTGNVEVFSGSFDGAIVGDSQYNGALFNLISVSHISGDPVDLGQSEIGGFFHGPAGGIFAGAFEFNVQDSQGSTAVGTFTSTGAELSGPLTAEEENELLTGDLVAIMATPATSTDTGDRGVGLISGIAAVLNDSPVIVGNVEDSGDFPSGFLAQDRATILGSSPIIISGRNNQFEINAGLADAFFGSFEQPVNFFPDPLNGTVVGTSGGTLPIPYAIGTPTDIANFTGTRTYVRFAGNTITDPQFELFSAGGQLSLDISSGFLGGNFDLSLAETSNPSVEAFRFLTSFSANVQGGLLTSTGGSGSVEDVRTTDGSSPITVEVTGFFLGDEGEFLQLGTVFYDETTNNPALDVASVGLYRSFFLTAQEVAAFAPGVQFVGVNADELGLVIGGPATAFRGANGLGILGIDDGVAQGLPFGHPLSSDFIDVPSALNIRGGAVAFNDSFTGPGIDTLAAVTWLSAGGAGSALFDSTTGGVNGFLPGELLFQVAQATPTSNLVGSASYGNATLTQGVFLDFNGQTGPITEFDLFFDMNFSTLALTNGQILIGDGGAQPVFDATFSGTLVTGIGPDYNALSIDTLEGIHVPSGAPLTAASNLSGFFSGDAADAFIGAFNIQGNVSGSPGAVGTFFVMPEPPGNPVLPLFVESELVNGEQVFTLTFSDTEGGGTGDALDRGTGTSSGIAAAGDGLFALVEDPAAGPDFQSGFTGLNRFDVYINGASVIAVDTGGPSSGNVSFVSPDHLGVTGLTWAGFEQPLTIFLDPLDATPTFVTGGMRDILVGVGTPVVPAATSGTRSYEGLDIIATTRSDLVVSSFSSMATLDLGNGDFDGFLSIQLSDSNNPTSLLFEYNTDFLTSVLGGTFSNTVTSNSTVLDVNAGGPTGLADVDLTGFLTGNDGEFASLAAAFSDPFNPTLDVNALVLLGPAPDNAIPLQASEITQLGSGHLYVGFFCCQDEGLIGGRASDIATEGVAGILGLNVDPASPDGEISGPEVANFFDLPPELFIRNETGLSSATTGFPATGAESLASVVWGDAQSVHFARDSATGISPNDFSAPGELVFLTALPTNIAPLTGQFGYSNTNLREGAIFDAAQDVRPIGVLDVSFDLDFDTGLVTNGVVEVDDIAMNPLFSAAFNGDVITGSGFNGLDVSITSGIYHPTGDALEMLDSTVEGFFTGANAEIFAGAVALRAQDTLQTRVAATFFLEQGAPGLDPDALQPAEASALLSGDVFTAVRCCFVTTVSTSAIVSGVSDGANLFGGQFPSILGANYDLGSGNPLRPLDTGFGTQPPNIIIRRESIPPINGNVDGTNAGGALSFSYELQGFDAAGPLFLRDSLDGSVLNGLNDNFFVIVGAGADVSSRMGTARFESVNFLNGFFSSELGTVAPTPLHSADVSFNVNFDTGAIFDGNLRARFEDPATHMGIPPGFDVAFNGSIGSSGGTSFAQLQVTEGFFDDPESNYGGFALVDPSRSELEGFFAGDGSAFDIAFSLVSMEDPLNPGSHPEVVNAVGTSVLSEVDLGLSAAEITELAEGRVWVGVDCCSGFGGPGGGPAGNLNNDGLVVLGQNLDGIGGDLAVSDPGFIATDPEVLFRQGGSQQVQFPTSFSLPSEAELGFVSWFGHGSPGFQVDVASGEIVDSLDDQVLFITGLPSNIATLQAAGFTTFSGSTEQQVVLGPVPTIEAFLDSNLPDVDPMANFSPAVSVSFNVDLASGSIDNGHLFARTTQDFDTFPEDFGFQVFFEGFIGYSGGNTFADLTITDGVFNELEAIDLNESDIDLFFAGDGPGAASTFVAAGAFHVQSAGMNPTVAAGTFAINNSLRPETRIGASESALLSNSGRMRFGLAAFSQLDSTSPFPAFLPVGAEGLLIGRGSEATGTFLLGANGYHQYQDEFGTTLASNTARVDFLSQPYDFVLTRDSATDATPLFDGNARPGSGPDFSGAGFAVGWGGWNSGGTGLGAFLGDDPANNANGVTIEQDVFFASVNPTPQSQLPSSGILTYSGDSTAGSLSFIGAGGGGLSGQFTAVPITDMAFSMTVDFGNGEITSGTFDASYASSITSVDGITSWQVGFDGFVNGPIADLEVLSLTVIDNQSVVSDTFPAMPESQSIGGVLTGPSGERFVGGFSFLANDFGGTAFETIQGILVVDGTP